MDAFAILPLVNLERRRDGMRRWLLFVLPVLAWSLCAAALLTAPSAVPADVPLPVEETPAPSSTPSGGLIALTFDDGPRRSTTTALLDGLKDGLLSIPILFLAYLLMELLERSSRLNEGLLRRYSRRAGPALGGLLGIVPQCGISGAAATLFSTGSITVGTMLAVFFATSDEMLPIFLSSLTESSGISWKTIVLITLSKAALGILLGYLADLLFGRWFRAQKSIHSFCEREHCDCDEEEGSVFLAALRHTLKIAAMLIAVNFALNLLFHYIGVERLSGTVLNRPVLGELILALFGLIPNCSVSVVVTESYLSGVLGLGGLFAGLLSNAGIGLLVLLRTNRNWKENAAVVAILYGFSVLAGIAVTLLAG